MCMYIYIYIYMFFVVPMFCFLLVSHYNLCNELQFPTCEACLAISCLQSCVETFFEMFSQWQNNEKAKGSRQKSKQSSKQFWTQQDPPMKSKESNESQKDVWELDVSDV